MAAGDLHRLNGRRLLSPEETDKEAHVAGAGIDQLLPARIELQPDIVNGISFRRERYVPENVLPVRRLQIIRIGRVASKLFEI